MPDKCWREALEAIFKRRLPGQSRKVSVTTSSAHWRNAFKGLAGRVVYLIADDDGDVTVLRGRHEMTDGVGIIVRNPKIAPPTEHFVDHDDEKNGLSHIGAASTTLYILHD